MIRDEEFLRSSLARGGTGTPDQVPANNVRRVSSRSGDGSALLLNPLSFASPRSCPDFSSSSISISTLFHTGMFFS